MKTKEFISATRELGLNISENHVEIVITDVRDYEICNVSKLNCFSMNTRGAVFINLESDVKEKLLTYLYEYAKTPLEEREEEKKYRYKLSSNFEIKNTLTRNLPRETFFFSSIEEEDYRDYTLKFQKYFTDKDVDRLPKDVRDVFNACEKIEVTP